MKMFPTAFVMWVVFKNNLKSNLSVLNISNRAEFIKQTKKKYKNIVTDIPSFGKNDILLINILSATMVAAVYLTAEKRPSLEQMTEYYSKVMDDSKISQRFLTSKSYYSNNYQKSLALDAEKSQKATNPYTWRFVYRPGPNINSFDAIYDKCGICELFIKLRISEITPAMCAYDYNMAKLTGTVFTRKYTLASGGKVCDCHYRKKN